MSLVKKQEWTRWVALFVFFRKRKYVSALMGLNLYKPAGQSKIQYHHATCF